MPLRFFFRSPAEFNAISMPISLHAAIQEVTQAVHVPFNHSSNFGGDGSECDGPNRRSNPIEADSGGELMERGGND